VTNSELLGHFNRHINNCGDDPAGKQRNRDAFKRSVNSVAVVKHVDGVKCVVAKNRYRDFVAKGDADGHHHGLNREFSSRPDPSCPTPISPASPIRSSDQAESGGEMLVNESDLQNNNNNLRYSFNLGVDCKDNAVLNNHSGIIDLSCVQKMSTGLPVSADHPDTEKSLKILNISGDHVCRTGRSGAVFAVISVNSPPRALQIKHPNHDFKFEYKTPEKPLPRQILKSLSQTAPAPNRSGPILGRNTWSTTSSQSCENIAALNGPPGTPITRPQSTTVTRKVDESVPLEPIAHDWLVKSGAGMWRHVHGLLLLDPQLVTRRDFMSGFTALHWAAKGGNGEMVRKIMDISKSQGTTTAATGVVDINSKTHGGYTPLHLAAIHDHKDVMTLLVQGYGARVNVRDNAGKKPYHYLLAGTGSAELKELLGGGQQQRDHPSRVQAEGEEEEHQQPRELLLLPKGLNTLSKLFQPTMGHHKKHRP